MASSERVDKWKAGWESGDIQFHLPKPHKTLVKYFGKLTDGEKGLKFYVPLCGKTLDMKWLVDKGQDVTGLEGVELACKQFFEEQSLEYAVSDIPGITNGKTYSGTSAKIKIYKCDVLAINSGITGKFDVVWDRGSLVAMDPPDREGYIKMLQDVTKQNTSILLETFQYDFDERIRKRAPYPLFRKDIDALFGDWCTISEEERSDMIDLNPGFREWGLTWMTNVVYIIRPN